MAKTYTDFTAEQQAEIDKDKKLYITAVICGVLLALGIMIFASLEIYELAFGCVVLLILLITGGFFKATLELSNILTTQNETIKILNETLELMNERAKS